MLQNRHVTSSTSKNTEVFSHQIWWWFLHSRADDLRIKYVEVKRISALCVRDPFGWSRLKSVFHQLFGIFISNKVGIALSWPFRGGSLLTQLGWGCMWGLIIQRYSLCGIRAIRTVQTALHDYGCGCGSSSFSGPDEFPSRLLHGPSLMSDFAVVSWRNSSTWLQLLAPGRALVLWPAESVINHLDYHLGGPGALSFSATRTRWALGSSMGQPLLSQFSQPIHRHCWYNSNYANQFEGASRPLPFSYIQWTSDTIQTMTKRGEHLAFSLHLIVPNQSKALWTPFGFGSLKLCNSSTCQQQGSFLFFEMEPNDVPVLLIKLFCSSMKYLNQPTLIILLSLSVSS